MNNHIIRIRYRQDAHGDSYLYGGECSCGFDCKFWSTERKVAAQ